MEYGWRAREPGAVPQDPWAWCPRGWERALPPGRVTALYFGSEFCQDALPLPERVGDWVESARDQDLVPVLLTPLVTSRGVPRVVRLLEALAGAAPRAEVVCNDVGVLRVVRSRFSGLRPRAGRVWNRALRDPRPGARPPNGEADRARRLRRFLADMGVRAIETDPDLVGGFLGAGGEGLERTLHLPFAFVASGRNCLVRADEGGGPPDDWVSGGPCGAACCKGARRILRSDVPGPLWRAGNTLFREAAEEDVRRDVVRADRVVLHEEPLP